MNFFYENRIELKLVDDEISMSIYENKDFNYLAHWHMEVEIAYVVEGKIYVGVNNNRQLLEEGSMVVCSSGDIHYYDSTELNSKTILMVFKPEFAGFPSNWSETLNLSSPFISKEKIDASGLSVIKNILYSILDEKHKKIKYFDLFIKAKIIEICGLLLRYQHTCNLESKTKTKSKTKTITNLKAMQNVLCYIEDNYMNDISLEKISHHFNVDVYNLSKRINYITGTNFKTYINSMKVLKSEEMILNTTKPLTEIALECGFNSIRTFNRVYKKIKGYVPSSIR